jgi:hypothetical protein
MNVLGKEVSDGSHNVVYKEVGPGEIANLTVLSVSTGENVKYKLAGVGELANAIVSISGGGVSLTVDSTLYTSDSTLITADQTEI